ncbi:MAG: flagellar export protein FliJ [Pirellulaceae bacterium]|jgi:flagellar export protein FliJ
MFRFRLETLLRLRLDDRDKRRGELAEAFEAERILEQRIEETETELEEVLHRSREIQAKGTLNIDGATERQRYQLLLRAQIQTLNQQLLQVGEETEKRQLLLIESDREVKKLDRLKEKQQTAHDKHHLLVESKRLDEIATLAHSRKRRD